MCPERHTLSKDERLHGRNDISRLFAEGKFGVAGSLKYCFSSAICSSGACVKATGSRKDCFPAARERT